jgi:hypothetical protein
MAAPQQPYPQQYAQQPYPQQYAQQPYPQQYQQPMPQQPATAPAAAPKKKTGLIIGIVVVIVIVIVAIVAVVLLMRPGGLTGFRVTGTGCWSGDFVAASVSTQNGCGNLDIPMGCGLLGTAAATVEITDGGGWTLTVQYLKDGVVKGAGTTTDPLTPAFVTIVGGC